MTGTSPLDPGPIYRETLMGRLPVEPFNTFSNLVFLFVVLYWGLRVYRDVRTHRFMALALPVLLLGFVGGTLFHATRSHALWLHMDWVPIMLLCLAATVLFAQRAGLRGVPLAALLILPFPVRLGMGHWLGWNTAVALNTGYAVIGIVVLLPLVLHLRENGWHNARLVVASVGCFATAIVFRALDLNPLTDALPMGTHWLWHLFGGMAVFLLMAYIHADDLRRKAMAG